MDADARAIVFADPAGRIRYSSPGAERLFGHAARDALGRVRVFPARFLFATDAHGRAVGALAVYAEPSGETRPFAPIQPPAGGPRG